MSPTRPSATRMPSVCPRGTVCVGTASKETGTVVSRVGLRPAGRHRSFQVLLLDSGQRDTTFPRSVETSATGSRSCASTASVSVSTDSRRSTTSAKV